MGCPTKRYRRSHKLRITIFGWAHIWDWSDSMVIIFSTMVLKLRRLCMTSASIAWLLRRTEACGSGLREVAGSMWTEIHFPKQAASLRIRALARGRDGTLWAGTLGGLFQMEPTAHVIQKTRDIKGGV